MRRKWWGEGGRQTEVQQRAEKRSGRIRERKWNNLFKYSGLKIYFIIAFNQQIFTYQACLSWKTLPLYICHTSTLASFKSALKRSIFRWGWMGGVKAYPFRLQISLTLPIYRAYIAGRLACLGTFG